MYDPIQIPFILNPKFSQNIKYTETSVEECGRFAICFWEMQSLSDSKLSVKNIIAIDACIDLVVNFDEKTIGFAGMSKTEFNFEVQLPTRSFGMRLTPGAFHQLTGLPADDAMDTFLPIEATIKDFNKALFFSLTFENAKNYFKKSIAELAKAKSPDQFTLLFHKLSEETPKTVLELCQLLHFSPRQCQRLFRLHYGITPKMALSIIRFHNCLKVLTSPNAKQYGIQGVTGYYDQPHFIKDFKRNIGITPLELIRAYQS